MDNTSTNQPRFKKVKRPIKRTTQAADNNIAVPAKATMDSPFNSTSSKSGNSNFNFNDYLGQDNLPQIQQDNKLNPSFLSDEDIDYQSPELKERFVVGNSYTGTALVAAILVSFILGIFITKMFFSAPATVQNGLQGVVINAEVPRGRARCGTTEKTQGCVLYIMNPQRQELNGRDFYEWAAQLTDRQRFIIETANMRYANVRVRPGEIAQINVPPLQ